MANFVSNVFIIKKNSRKVSVDTFLKLFLNETFLHPSLGIDEINV